MHGFILDRKWKILLLSYPGRDRSVRATEILISLLLFHYAWTRQWPDQTVILRGLVTPSPWSL